MNVGRSTTEFFPHNRISDCSLFSFNPVLPQNKKYLWTDTLPQVKSIRKPPFRKV